jgi:hypothetical protein
MDIIKYLFTLKIFLFSCLPEHSLGAAGGCMVGGESPASSSQTFLEWKELQSSQVLELKRTAGNSILLNPRLRSLVSAHHDPLRHRL